MVRARRRMTKGEILGARDHDSSCEHHRYPCLRANLISSLCSKQTWGDRIPSLWAASACTWTQSGGLHSGAAQYWLREVRGRRVRQKMGHPWSSHSLSKGWDSPGAELHGAQAMLYGNQSHSQRARFAALLSSSLDSSLAVPSGTPPQWFIDSSLPPTAPLRPCTHNTWQLIGIC